MSSGNSEENIKPASNGEFKRLMIQKAQEQGHKRQQNLLNALTSVCAVLIYIIPGLLIFLYLSVLIHRAIIGDWDKLEDTLKDMIIPVTSYMVGVLSRTVLPKNNE